MKVGRVGFSIAAFVAVMMLAAPASAQYGGQPAPKKQPQQQQAPGNPKGVTCAPSGFARLKRNCTGDTGGCQRMPDSCSNGWCCP
jgi:hypothetical protein